MACGVWLARDYLARAGRPIDIPPCTHSTDLCPPIKTDPEEPTMSAPYYADDKQAEFCELCDTTIGNGEPYYKEGTVAYHEKCAATCEDGSPDHGLSRMVAINRRLTLRPTNAAAS